MSEREFFTRRWLKEFPITVRVFQALPAGKLDFRPHAKSRSAAELLSLMAYEGRTNVEAVDTGQINWQEPKPTASVESQIQIFTKAGQEFEKRLAKLDDSDWKNKKIKFLVGGQFIFEEPLGELLWLTLFDLIHHRGQLSTYLRPMGGKVPSIYGPSADDTGS